MERPQEAFDPGGGDWEAGREGAIGRRSFLGKMEEYDAKIKQNRHQTD